MSRPNAESQTRLVRAFSAVERWGQRLPDPLTLFLVMAGLVIVLSAIFAGATEELPREFPGKAKTSLCPELA